MSTVDRTVAVIGAGSIGVGWAIVFARAGMSVALHDVDPQRRALAQREVHDTVAELHRQGLLDDPDGLLDRVRTAADIAEALVGAVHVQECAPEDLDLKRRLFAQLDETVPSDAVLASSSSALAASQFASDLVGRSRCLVAHPANPPYLLPVVEIVPAPFTSLGAVGATRDLLTDARMSVVVLRREIEGFVYNRLQGALLREAYCLVRDGVVEPEDVDTIVYEGLGRRWSVIGPFETAHLNTRGGIEAHARRLGPAYARMGAERGQDDPWNPELVERVARSVHRRFPLDSWGESVAWRDRALMALERARHERPELFRPPSRDACNAKGSPHV